MPAHEIAEVVPEIGRDDPMPGAWWLPDDEVPPDELALLPRERDALDVFRRQEGRGHAA
jgi:hypothetical protein